MDCRGSAYWGARNARWSPSLILPWSSWTRLFLTRSSSSRGRRLSCARAYPSLSRLALCTFGSSVSRLATRPRDPSLQPCSTFPQGWPVPSRWTLSHFTLVFRVLLDRNSWHPKVHQLVFFPSKLSLRIPYSWRRRGDRRRADGGSRRMSLRSWSRRRGSLRNLMRGRPFGLICYSRIVERHPFCLSQLTSLVFMQASLTFNNKTIKDLNATGRNLLLHLLP